MVEEEELSVVGWWLAVEDEEEVGELTVESSGAGGGLFSDN